LLATIACIEQGLSSCLAPACKRIEIHRTVYPRKQKARSDRSRGPLCWAHSPTLEIFGPKSVSVVSRCQKIFSLTGFWLI
jgi:hypothetical protein